ncbi:MAG: tRNA-dihydrouridine synthase [Candidatus Nomurabacteria bacterium]|jgi:tRNA-dihydrouridine synthase|nr:tRNA-dihydrouridine synthase [Candidatus Nomurabacteria bacterium]
MNFWNKLNKPFFCLAPMEDVTDAVFRQVILRAARPEVFFTEFMNVDGFCHPAGRESVARRLKFSPTEMPIVAQIWGSKPENFAQTAAELAKMGFAGIDINMGCPDKSVIKSGGGASLIKTPELATKIIQTVKQELAKSSDPDRAVRVDRRRGSPEQCFPRAEKFSGEEFETGPEHPEDELDFAAIPISVKTRIGFSKIDEWQSWLTTLLEQDLAALTIHLRTRKEMSKVPAHYELIPDIIKLRNQIAPATKLIINGDIADRAAGLKLHKVSPSLDGLMIGRGVFANPFCFEKNPRPHDRTELLDLLKYHLELFDQSGNQKYEPLKKFFKIYINGFSGAKEIRNKLMLTTNTNEARAALEEL